MAKSKTSRPSKSTANDAPQIEAMGEEIGAELYLPFSTPFSAVNLGVAKTDDEKLMEIGRTHNEDDGPTVRQLVTMRRMDGQARALYRLLALPIRSALSTHTFVADEDGEEEAEFIKDVFHLPSQSGGMSVTFQRVMSQILQGLFDGFAAFEKVFWVPEEGPLKGKVTLKKLAHRPAETVTFVADETGGFAGFRQQTVVNGKTRDVFIPGDYAFYYAAQEEERKFYGVSYFQSAFYHYDKKVKLYYTAHLAAQRAAVGTRVGTIPAQASKSAKQEFAQNLARLSLAQWMMLPEGFKVDSLREGGSFDFLSLINHHNSQMSKSVLASFFDQSQGGGSSDTSLVNFAQPGDDMFVLMLRAVMDDIANSINHYIIPQLIDLNFDSGKYPKFVWGTLTDEQRSAISATFDKIVVAGQSVNATPEFVRALEEQMAEDMGLDIDYEEVAEREEAEKALAAAQGVDAMGNPLPGGPAGAEVPSGVPGGAGAEGQITDAPITEDQLGLSGKDWGLDDFEAALDAYKNGGEPPQEEDSEVPLTQSEDALVRLAAEMMEMARLEDSRA